MAQDTIEIYVRDLTEEEAAGWLRSVFDEVEQVRASPIVTYEGQYDGDAVSVQVTEQVKNGPYTNLWINASSGPWEAMDACARDAHEALGREVLCYPESVEEPWTVLRLVEGEETRVDDRELDAL